MVRRKPKLILHPGFAKCATTSLQWQFCQSAHALPRALGVIWIGKAFVPFNGVPPVMEIGYEPSKAIESLRNQALDPEATYFLSAESLPHAKSVLELLRDLFEVVRVVVTIRFPLFIEISEYTFRGWITSPIESLVEPAGGSIARKNNSCRRMIEEFETFFDQKVRLCPLELPDLERRFLRDAFEIVPEKALAALSDTEPRNASASIALAAELHAALGEDREMLSPERRRALIRLLQQEPGPSSIGSILPDILRTHLSDQGEMDKRISAYDRILQDSLSEDQIREVNASIRARIDGMLANPPVDAATQAALHAHVRALVAKARTLA